MSTAIEPGLLDRCSTGDHAALRELVERHQALVYGVALAVTRDPALAEDVSQETFVEAWRQLSSLRDHDRLGPWLAGIARNLGRNAVRKLQRQRFSSSDSSKAPTPLDDMLAREVRLVVRECLAEVPEAFREALVLFYLKEKSVRQVAQDLGVSEELVKQRLTRGRRAMRQGMAEVLGGALDRARPGPALAGSIVAALTAASWPARASGVLGKVLLVMSMKKASVAAVVLGLAAIGLWYGESLTAGERRPAAASSEDPPQQALAARAPASGESPRPAASVSASRKSHEADWRRLRALVQQARERREERSRSALPAAGRSGPADERRGSLDKNTIGEAIQTILPLVKECYEQALERAGGADSKGRVVVDFRIEGEPGVGGIVTESSVNAEKSTISDPLTRECVQESMYALRLPPPKNGGVVRVRYPFVFSSGQQAGEASPAR